MEETLGFLAEHYFLVSAIVAIFVATISALVTSQKADKIKFGILYIFVIMTTGATLKVARVANENHKLLSSAMPVVMSSDASRSIVDLNKARKEFSSNANNSMNAILNRYVSKQFSLLSNAAEDGVIIVPRGDETKIATILLESATSTVLATSYVSPDAWWEGKAGKDYLEFNRNIIENNNVKVKRIFIIPPSYSIKKLSPLLDCNSTIGVETYIAFEKDIVGRRREDVIIVDGTAVAGRLDLSRELDIIKSEFSSRSSFVKEQKETFDYIFKQSRLHETGSSQCSLL